MSTGKHNASADKLDNHSDLETTSTESSSFNEQTVIDYLNHHPDFLHQYAEQLNLKLIDLQAEDNSSNTVSFAQRQNDSLRKQKESLQTKLDGLIQVAKDNEALFNQTRHTIVDLVAKTQLSDLIRYVETKMADAFKIDIAQLFVFDDANNTGLSKQDAQDSLHHIVSNNHVVCGTFRPQELDAVFSDKSADIASAAVAPLWHQENLIGLLAFGSADDKHFQTGSATDLIDFIRDILSLCIHRCLSSNASSELSDA